MITIKLLIVCMIMLMMRVNSQEDDCIQVCQDFELFDCFVCYKQCESSSKSNSSPKTNFKFTSCKQKYCSSQKTIQKTNKDGEIETRQYCERYEYRTLSEKLCLSKCCRDRSNTKFTKDNFQSCLKFNKDANTITYIIYGGVVAVILIYLAYLSFSGKGKNKSQ